MAVIDCLEDRDETLKRKTVSYISVPHTALFPIVCCVQV
jgi:hypothetical protein